MKRKQKNSKKRLIKRLVNGDKRAMKRLRKLGTYRIDRDKRLKENEPILDDATLIAQTPPREGQVIFELTNKAKSLLGEV